MCGDGERELKALKHGEVNRVNLIVSEGALGKHIALPHSEDSQEVSRKMLLAAPLCGWCAHTHPVGKMLHNTLAVRWTKL